MLFEQPIKVVFILKRGVIFVQPTMEKERKRERIKTNVRMR